MFQRCIQTLFKNVIRQDVIENLIEVSTVSTHQINSQINEVTNLPRTEIMQTAQNEFH